MHSDDLCLLPLLVGEWRGLSFLLEGKGSYFSYHFFTKRLLDGGLVERFSMALRVSVRVCNLVVGDNC